MLTVNTKLQLVVRTSSSKEQPKSVCTMQGIITTLPSSSSDFCLFLFSSQANFLHLDTNNSSLFVLSFLFPLLFFLELRSCRQWCPNYFVFFLFLIRTLVKRKNPRKIMCTLPWGHTQWMGIVKFPWWGADRVKFKSDESPDCGDSLHTVIYNSITSHHCGILRGVISHISWYPSERTSFCQRNLGLQLVVSLISTPRICWLCCHWSGHSRGVWPGLMSLLTNYKSNLTCSFIPSKDI